MTDDEREQLVRWSRRRKSSQALALRSRIVLACAAGTDNKTVASELGCAQVTVGKWRSRFVEHLGDDRVRDVILGLADIKDGQAVVGAVPNCGFTGLGSFSLTSLQWPVLMSVLRSYCSHDLGPDRKAPAR